MLPSRRLMHKIGNSHYDSIGQAGGDDCFINCLERSLKLEQVLVMCGHILVLVQASSFSGSDSQKSQQPVNQFSITAASEPIAHDKQIGSKGFACRKVWFLSGMRVGSGRLREFGRWRRHRQRKQRRLPGQSRDSPMQDWAKPGRA